MKFKLPRGIISHDLYDSILFFIKSFFSDLDNNEDVKALELEMSSRLGSDHCTSFPLARTAIYFILKNLGYPPGTKILLSPITIKGILDVVINLGYQPVYTDIDARTYIPSEESIDGLDSEIRVALITPLYGVIPDLETISFSLKSKNIYSILDFSHCFGAKFNNKFINNYFDASVYSSSSIKILDTLGGGHVLTDDDNLDVYLKNSQRSLSPTKRANIISKSWINLIRNLATQRILFSLFTFPLINFITKFSKRSSLKMTGDRDKFPEKNLPNTWFNKFSSLQANIGLKVIKEIDQRDNSRIEFAREVIQSIGKEYFADDKYNNNVYWQLIFQVKDTQHFQKFCLGRGVDIATSSLLLISDLPNYKGRTQLKDASNLYHNGCLIPCNSRLNSKDRKRLSNILEDYIEEVS